MIKLSNFLPEGKQVGILYHNTSYKNMCGIVKKDFTFLPQPTYSSGERRNSTHVSLTRNKDFVSETTPLQVRLTLDGNKLAQRYKIEPYADIEGGFGRHAAIDAVQQEPTYYRHAAGEVDEAEERISYLRYPNGVKIKDALLGIQVLDAYSSEYEYDAEYYDELIGILDSKGIKYTMVEY